MIFLKRNLKYWKTLSKNALRALLPNEARKMGKRPEKQPKRMKSEHGKLLQFVAKTKKVSLVEKEMQQSKGWEMRRGRYLNPFPSEFSLPETKLQSATPTILAPPIVMTLDNHPQKNKKIGK